MLSRGNAKEAVRLIELPTDQRPSVLRAFLQQVPGGLRFFSSSDPTVVVGSAARYPVFRVEPLGPVA